GAVRAASRTGHNAVVRDMKPLCRRRADAAKVGKRVAPVVAQQKTVTHTVKDAPPQDVPARVDRSSAGERSAGIVDGSELSAAQQVSMVHAGGGITTDNIAVWVDAGRGGKGGAREIQRSEFFSAEQECMAGARGVAIAPNDVASRID